MSARRARVDVYQDAAGGWRFRVIAANGRNVGPASEAYASKRNARRGAFALWVALDDAMYVQ